MALLAEVRRRDILLYENGCAKKKIKKKTDPGEHKLTIGSLTPINLWSLWHTVSCLFGLEWTKDLRAEPVRREKELEMFFCFVIFVMCACVFVLEFREATKYDTSLKCSRYIFLYPYIRSIFSTSFILVRVMAAPQSISGTPDTRREYTLDGMPVHHGASCTRTVTPTASQSTY